MKFEIRCPGCNKSFLVDEPSLQGGHLLCPGCDTAIVVRLRPAGSATAPVATQPAPPAELPGAASATAAEPAAVTQIAAAATMTPPAPVHAAAEEVVCPRCHLHFMPRGQSARPAESSRPRVLIVEDMPFFREVAADALSEEYEIFQAESVTDARARLAEGKIDLMILDLRLDGPESGLDLLRSLRAKPCPILIFTAQDESEMYGDSWDELRQLGADDMVLKGMNAGELLVRKVGTLLGKRWDEED